MKPEDYLTAIIKGMSTIIEIGCHPWLTAKHINGSINYYGFEASSHIYKRITNKSNDQVQIKKYLVSSGRYNYRVSNKECVKLLGDIPIYQKSDVLTDGIRSQSLTTLCEHIKNPEIVIINQSNFLDILLDDFFLINRNLFIAINPYFTLDIPPINSIYATQYLKSIGYKKLEIDPIKYVDTGTCIEEISKNIKGRFYVNSNS